MKMACKYFYRPTWKRENVLPATCRSCSFRDRISAVSLSTSALFSSSLCCNSWMYELTDCDCCCWDNCCSWDWNCPTEDPVTEQRNFNTRMQKLTDCGSRPWDNFCCSWDWNCLNGNHEAEDNIRNTDVTVICTIYYHQRLGLPSCFFPGIIFWINFSTK